MAGPAVDLTDCDTLPKVLAFNAKHYGDEIAFREKDLGIWNEYSWASRSACARSASARAMSWR